MQRFLSPKLQSSFHSRDSLTLLHYHEQARRANWTPVLIRTGVEGEKKVFHLDIHEGNIFYKQLNKNEYKWYLIDYGRVYRGDDGFPVTLQSIIHRAQKEKEFENVDEILNFSLAHLYRYIFHG